MVEESTLHTPTPTDEQQAYVPVMGDINSHSSDGKSTLSCFCLCLLLNPNLLFVDLAFLILIVHSFSEDGYISSSDDHGFPIPGAASPADTEDSFLYYEHSVFDSLPNVDVQPVFNANDQFASNSNAQRVSNDNDVEEVVLSDENTRLASIRERQAQGDRGRGRPRGRPRGRGRTRTRARGRRRVTLELSNDTEDELSTAGGISSDLEERSEPIIDENGNEQRRTLYIRVFITY